MTFYHLNPVSPKARYDDPVSGIIPVIGSPITHFHDGHLLEPDSRRILIISLIAATYNEKRGCIYAVIGPEKPEFKAFLGKRVQPSRFIDEMLGKGVKRWMHEDPS